MKAGFFYSITVALLLVFSGCNNKCKELNCQNGADCYDGDCNCQKWFSGESCQLRFNRNYEGEYAGKEISHGRSMNETWEIRADGNVPNRMYMPNDAYFEFDSDSTFIIPRQAIEETGETIFIEGSGTYSLEEIWMSYTLEYSSGMVLQKQFTGTRVDQ